MIWVFGFVMLLVCSISISLWKGVANGFIIFAKASASEKIKGMIFGFIVCAVLVGIIVGYAFLSNMTINPY